MEENILEIKDLTIHYVTDEETVEAVNGITLTLQKGESLGLVGETGCGKSTLGRTVIHLHERTSGEIYFNGKDISDVTKQQLKVLREDMQMIFQDPFSSCESVRV